MVGVLIRLKVVSLRHALQGGQSSTLWTAWTIGAVLALVTLNVGVGARSDAAEAFDKLAIAFLLWTGVWILVPLMGGASDPLRVEYFNLLPVRAGRLARALLAAAIVGVLPAVTLLAFVTLVVVAAPFGFAAALVALSSTVLLLGLALAGSKVAGALVSRAVQSRVGIELAALVYALLVASTWIWLPLAAVPSGSRLTGDSSALAGVLPVLVRVLPTGWGIVAVEAVIRSDWLLTVAALAALIALVGGLMFTWSTLVGEQLYGRGPRSTAWTRSRGRLVEWLLDRLPRTRVGAITAKELLAWTGQPRRRVQLRVPIWTAILLVVVPGLLGAVWLWPFAGVIVAWAAGVTAANVYGYDGTALWLTLTIPGTERADVRGRQAAWLILFGSTAFVATVVLTITSGQSWAWAWVGTALPATIGAAAGLVPLVSLAVTAPLPDRRGDSPMDLGDDPRTQGQLLTQGILMTTLVPLLVAPAVLVAYAGSTVDPRLAWLGAPTGIILGLAYGWLLGDVASALLVRRGPELLERMRARPASGTTGTRRSTQVPLRSWVAILCGSLLLFAQGVAPLALVVARSPSRLWFLPLYLPQAFQVPAIAIFMASGIAAYGLAWHWLRRAKEHA